MGTDYKALAEEILKGIGRTEKAVSSTPSTVMALSLIHI